MSASQKMFLSELIFGVCIVCCFTGYQFGVRRSACAMEFVFCFVRKRTLSQVLWFPLHKVHQGDKLLRPSLELFSYEQCLQATLLVHWTVMCQ